MGESRDDQDDETEADPDPAVVVDGCRMTKQPAREDHQQHRQHERDASDKRADRVGRDRLADLRPDEEPLHYCAGDREQHQEEGESVAPLVFLEGLGTERAEHAAGRVSQAQPHPHDQCGALFVADVPLGRRR